MGTPEQDLAAYLDDLDAIERQQAAEEQALLDGIECPSCEEFMDEIRGGGQSGTPGGLIGFFCFACDAQVDRDAALT